MTIVVHPGIAETIRGRLHTSTRLKWRETLSSRVTIAMASLVLLSVLAVGGLTYLSVEATLLPRALSRTELELRLLTTQLAAYVSGARQGVAAAHGTALQGIIRARLGGGIDPVDNVTEDTWRQRLAGRFTATLTAQPAYDKLRLLSSDDGRELVRVDRYGENGAIRIVPDNELLDKSDRDFVKGALALPAGQIFVSRVEPQRKRDGSMVRVPHALVLHVGGPVQTKDQKPFGVIIIDVNMRPILRDMALGARSGGQVYVVDDRGNYLLHPDPEREFAFDLGKAARWQSDFPELVPAFDREETMATALIDAAGEAAIGGISTIRLASGPHVAVLETMPRSVVMPVTAAIGRSALVAGSIAFLCACVLAVLLARSLTRPLVQMTAAVEAFPNDQTITMPQGAAGEIGVLAAAFARMMEEVKTKTASLEREVQEHSRTEAELARHADRERLFGAAVQSSYDAIVTMTLDGIVTGWNPAAVRLYGWSADEMFGRSIDMIVPDELRSEVREILQRIRRGEAVTHHETVRLSKDRRRIEVSLGVSPIKLPSGAIIGACKIAHDISADRKAKLLLEHESNERRRIAEVLHNTITSMNDAVVVADKDSTILLSNPAAERLLSVTAGLTSQEWTSRHEVLMPDGVTTMPTAQRPLARALRGETFENYEMVVRRRASQDSRIFVAQGGPIRSGRQQDASALVVYRDVTAAKRTERELRQAQKMEVVGQLTGGVAHDFNNILTVITGTIEILAEGVADRPALAAIAHMIDDAAGRGAELTKHLVAFSRRQPLEPRETNVNEIIVETGRLLRPTLGENIEIEAILDDNVAPALIDPSQLSTAILNLAINSRDAMPQGGKLMLESKNVVLDDAYARMNAEVQAGDYVMIAVSDTGTGIPAAILDKVYEPFFTTKETGKGSGLGLSMVYGFVKQSGGHIKIYSEANLGTTIKMYLPRAVAAATPSLDRTPIPYIQGGDETILVVEDDLLVRNYVVERLQALGYATLAAADAAEAIAFLDGGTKIDLLFTDVVMPGAMNGRQLADAAVQRRPNLRVLFTSGYTETAIVHHGRLDPGVLLLAKPYRKADLARMIKIALGTAAQ